MLDDEQATDVALRTYAQVVTPEIAKERRTAGGLHPEGRLLSDVLSETGGRYECILDSFPDRVMAGLRHWVALLFGVTLVIPFENLRGLDPATTRVVSGFQLRSSPGLSRSGSASSAQGSEPG